MPYRDFPKVQESADELYALQQRLTHKYRSRKVRMLWLIKTEQAKTRLELAALLDTNNKTVGNWLFLYQDKGLDGLLERHPTGIPTGTVHILPDEVLEALGERLNGEGFSSYVHAQQWVAQTFGVEVEYDSLRKLLKRRFGAKLKVPRPSHAKKKRRRVSSSKPR